MSEGFTPNQRLAVETMDRPVTVTASAGSGKTRVLVARYVALIHQGIPPREIMAVTFTRKAAHEIKERVAKEFANNPKLARSITNTRTIGTFHSICYELLRTYGSAASVPTVRDVITEFTMATIFQETWEQWTRNLEEPLERELSERGTLAELELLAQKLYPLRQKPVWQEADDKMHLLKKALGPLWKDLEAHTLHQGKYTYDDLENSALKLVFENPELKARLQTHFKAFLVDEFQDTSMAQWCLIEQLVGVDRHKLFVVGDPKQSIYRFRGADVRLFLEIATDLESQGGSTIPLNTNFRSRTLLIEAINAMSLSLLGGTSTPYAPMESGSRTDETDEAVRWLPLQDEDNELGTASETIRIGQEVERLIQNGKNPNSIALLFRVADRMPSFAAELEARGIAFSLQRSTPLMSTYVAQDIATYLKALHNPSDDFVLWEWLRGPYVGLSREAMEALKPPKGATLWDNLKSQCPLQLSWFVQLHEGPPPTLQQALLTLFKNSSYFPENRSALLFLWEKFGTETLSLSEALFSLRAWNRGNLIESFNEQAGQVEAVRLLTVHAAKGLEFDEVFIVDPLRIPSRTPPLFLWNEGEGLGLRWRENEEWVSNATYDRLREKQTVLDLEESKRLLYVALTRAKNRLWITMPARATKIPKGSWADFLAEARETLTNTKVPEASTSVQTSRTQGEETLSF